MNFNYHEIGTEAMTVSMDELEEMIVGYTKVVSILKDAKKYRNKLGDYTSKQQTAKQNGSKNRSKNPTKNTTQDINVESNIPVDVPTQNLTKDSSNIPTQNPTKNSSNIQPKNTPSSRPISSYASYQKIKPEVK